MATQKRLEWDEHIIGRLVEEGGGLYDLCVFFSSDMPELMLDALTDLRSAKVLGVIEQVLMRAVSWDKTAPPPVCFCCGATLKAGTVPCAVIVVLPKIDDPTLTVCGVACRRCAGGGRKAVLKRALAGWRMLDPKARAIGDVHPDTGHA